MTTKTAALCTVLLLVGFGCAAKDSGQLTPQQIQEIKSEVKATTDALTAKTELLDMQGFFEYCLDSPDWTFLGPDGSRVDYQTARTASIEGYRNLAGHKLTPAHENIVVLSKDTAIWGWVGRVEDLMRSGEKATTDPLAVTLVLKKNAGQWKVIWWHTSCNPPVMQKAEK